MKVQVMVTSLTYLRRFKRNLNEDMRRRGQYHEARRRQSCAGNVWTDEKVSMINQQWEEQRKTENLTMAMASRSISTTFTMGGKDLP